MHSLEQYKMLITLYYVIFIIRWRLNVFFFCIKFIKFLNHKLFPTKIKFWAVGNLCTFNISLALISKIFLQQLIINTETNFSYTFLQLNKLEFEFKVQEKKNYLKFLSLRYATFSFTISINIFNLYFFLSIYSFQRLKVQGHKIFFFFFWRS